jgi:thiamine-monophosphate kinase
MPAPKPAKEAPISESEVIAKLAARFPQADPRLLAGIGDDAAVLRWCGENAGARRADGADLVVTTDLAVEGVHFSRRVMRLADAGYKALAMNLSDIAAMGAQPSFAFGCLGLPAGATSAEADELLSGVAEAAKLGPVTLAGGDTVRAPQWVIGFTVLGELSGQPLLRSGARPGDLLWHSGALGLSQAGMHMLWGAGGGRSKSPLPELRAQDIAALVAAHRRPAPQLALGAWLQREGLATSCIDLSDSLAQCLLLVAQASGVGLALDFGGYCFAEPLARFVQTLPRGGARGGSAAGGNARDRSTAQGFRVPARMDPARHATSYASLSEFVLASAEDFQLLFTAPPAATARLLAESPAPLAPLGRVVTAAVGQHYRDERGVTHELTPLGFEHLAAR